MHENVTEGIENKVFDYVTRREDQRITSPTFMRQFGKVMRKKHPEIMIPRAGVADVVARSYLLMHTSHPMDKTALEIEIQQTYAAMRGACNNSAEKDGQILDDYEALLTGDLTIIRYVIERLQEAPSKWTKAGTLLIPSRFITQAFQEVIPTKGVALQMGEARLPTIDAVINATELEEHKTSDFYRLQKHFAMFVEKHRYTMLI